MEKREPLLPLHTYHIFNRANGAERAFLSDENYRHFLTRLQEYILPVARVYAYCLLPNHFHLLAQIREEEVIIDFQKTIPNKIPTELPAPFVAQQFGNAFNSYTKSFNKKYERRGSLFMRRFKRNLALTEEDFLTFLFYIHKNPVHHGLCAALGQWRYCSYNAFLSNAPTMLEREYVLDKLGGTQGFIEFHQKPVYLKGKELE